jgi:MoxR-like ATPase
LEPSTNPPTPFNATPPEPPHAPPNIAATVRLLEHGRKEIGKVIAGQTELIDQALITVLSRGHALVEGVPGIAKTLLVKLLARVLGLDFGRVQATPDLMPADILGTSILQAEGAQMIFRPGPVFTDFLLVDEINRMPPRTQSALLECMEERQVTTDTERRPLPEVFTVFATQNPIDFEGTYPLPEAQLDRFLMKIRVGYPTVEQERLVLERHHAGFDPASNTELIPVPAGLLAAAQAEQRLVRIEPELYDYLLGITRRTRDWPSLTLGASPRAAISLMRVAQSYAALDGRDFVIPDDVKEATLPVLRHRVMLRPEAELEGLDADRVLTDVMAAVPVPRQPDPAQPRPERVR